MSMCYWMNEGVGIRDGKVWPKLNNHKCFLEAQKLYPENFQDEDEFDVADDIDCGDCFQNLGDFLNQVNGMGLCLYGDNGDGEAYFLYPPKFPWETTEKDPKTLEEARNLIASTICKVTDMSLEEALQIVEDHIYEYGCG